MKRQIKRQMGIAIAIALVGLLVVPGLALAEEPLFQMSETLDTGMTGGISDGSSSLMVKCCPGMPNQLIETKTLTNVVVLETESVSVTPSKVDKHQTVDWVGEGLTKTQQYTDGLLIESQTLNAGPGSGHLMKDKVILKRSSLDINKTLLYDGAGIMQTMSVMNVGDVNAGVGMSVDAVSVDEVASVSTTDDGIDDVDPVPAHCEWVEAHCAPAIPPSCVHTGPGIVGPRCVGPDPCGEADPGECVDDPCCTFIPAHCEEQCVRCPGIPAREIPAHCEWVEEVEAVEGVQDKMQFDLHITAMGTVAAGITVLPGSDQTMDVTEQQSYTGQFTLAKTYMVTDDDPVPAEAPPGPPLPIPPVP